MNFIIEELILIYHLILFLNYKQLSNNLVIFSFVNFMGFPLQLGSLRADCTKALMLGSFTPIAVNEVGIFNTLFRLLKNDINP